MKDELDMNANLLVEFLQKPSAEFTKADIVSYIKEKNIRMVNFMYPAGDGRLKTLNFVINNAAFRIDVNQETSNPDLRGTCGRF